nr:hypothetical protein [uncultured Flavobacterium sp.]
MSVYKLSVCPKNGGKKYDKMTFSITKNKKQKAKSKKQKAKGKRQITKFQKRHPERSRRANPNS